MAGLLVLAMDLGRCVAVTNVLGWARGLHCKNVFERDTRTFCSCILQVSVQAGQFPRLGGHLLELANEDRFIIA